MALLALGNPFGSETRQKIEANQEIATNVVQVSTVYCNITAVTEFNNNNVIIKGSNGNFDFSQRATIDNSSCNMNSSLDAEIETIIQAMLNQSASAQSGFSLDFTTIKQNTSIYQTINNSITQMMTSSCNITASNTRNNNYIFVSDSEGNFDFSQNSSIDSSTCNMSNIAKTTVYNKAATETEQQSKITNIFAIMFMAIIVCMILGAIILVIVLVLKPETAQAIVAAPLDPNVVAGQSAYVAEITSQPTAAPTITESLTGFTPEQMSYALDFAKLTGVIPPSQPVS